MAIDLDLLNLTPPQREAAMRALSRPPEDVRDENGAIRPLAALADLLRRLPLLRMQYQAYDIDEAVLRDTLTDVPIWMDTCHRQTGAWGMREYDWLQQHFSFRLFRLGRLQFMLQHSLVPAYVFCSDAGEIVTLARPGARFTTAGEADGTNGLRDPRAWTAELTISGGMAQGYRIAREGLAEPAMVSLPLDTYRPYLFPGDPVLDVHIPEGGPLKPQAVEASLAAAPAFFAKHFGATDVRAFTCGSWMLDWALPHILPGSNLAAFQQRFYCVPVPTGEGQMLERVYGYDAERPECIPESTSLQRAIHRWYEDGNRCRNASGFIPIRGR